MSILSIYMACSRYVGLKGVPIWALHGIAEYYSLICFMVHGALGFGWRAQC